MSDALKARILWTTTKLGSCSNELLDRIHLIFLTLNFTLDGRPSFQHVHNYLIKMKNHNNHHVTYIRLIYKIFKTTNKHDLLPFNIKKIHL